MDKITIYYLFKPIIRMSHYCFAVLVLICTLSCILMASESNSQQLSQFKVDLKAESSSLEDIFTSIEGQTDFVFSYAENINASSTYLNVNFSNTRLDKVLEYLSEKSSISFRRINQMLLVSRLQSKTSEEKFQGTRITGRVTSMTDGAPIPGANVIIKGTNEGTITDVNGAYAIEIDNPNTILIFSFVGFTSEEMVVGNRNVIDVILAESMEALQEIVITALGLKREERTLGYSVEKVGGEALNRVAQENVLNSMAGKVAGATISSTGGPGSSVSMVIRGATSLASDNQPLFVIDGVPFANTLNNVTQIGNDNRVDYGNAISGLNPDDIENVTILKGPSAAALYGSRAGNGVVLITTKTGQRAKKMTVSVTSNAVFDMPFKFLKWQTQFGSGQFSAIPPSISGTPLSMPFGTVVEEHINATFGPELDRGYLDVQRFKSPIDPETGQLVPVELISHKNNVRNFVETGVTTTNGVSIANNTDVISYRISYANMRNKGIIPNSDLFRNTLNINTNMKLSEKVSISTNVDFSRNNSNNRPAGERGTNPLQWAYNTSPHVDIRDMRDYWMPGQEGLQQKTLDAHRSIKELNNPYFLAYEVNNSFVRDRVYGNIKADWQISPSFSFFARYALDNFSEIRESKIANSYSQDPRGAYGLVNLRGFESNADFLLAFNKDIKDFSIAISGGGNIRYNTNSSVRNASKPGAGLITPNVFTLQNIAPDDLEFSSFSFQRGINSLYALTNLGFRDMIYLDLTSRWDWSSTLPQAQSYFYPSASLSVMVDEMINLPSNFNLLKLRGGIASVGNDTEPYRLIPALQNAGAWGNVPRLTLPNDLLNPFLKPEIATSYEYGIDLGFFNNRINFSGTYYQMENRNQIFSPLIAPSSGYNSRTVNAGLLESKGIELTLSGTPVVTRNFHWDINLNFTRNRTRIIELTDDLPYLELWTDARGGAWTFVGDQIGDIYDAKVVTVEDQNSPYFGFPILNAQSGKWQDIDAVNARNRIGNFNPDFILGMQTSLNYKNFSLNLTFDWRQGGEFVSQTYRFGEEHGRSQLFLDKLINPGDLEGRDLRDYLMENKESMILLNDGNFPLVGGPTPDMGGYPFRFAQFTLPYGGVFIPGVYATAFDENGNPTEFAENLGENINEPGGTIVMPYAGSTAWSFARAFLFDASFLKLREVSLGYDLPMTFTNRLKMQNINVSVYSRNIILWTAAKINVDPEMAFQPQAGAQAGTQFKQGIERYNVMPWVMPIGVKLRATF